MAGIGSKFLRKGDSDDTYVAIAKIKEMGEISNTRDTQDVTCFDSTGGYREFAPGLRDGGELSLVMIFKKTDAGQVALQGDYNKNEAHDYKIELSDDDKSSFSFQGIVTSFGVAIPLEEEITRSVTVKITGPLTEGTWTE
ncbi:phage tail tube protein [Endozoicomonas sp. Mp262]|uniref:phage tail tube protein n=1 Tax=Endozoicomonas sp. Mp262 TaxID=2919499 RepID=UPI0021D90B01